MSSLSFNLYFHSCVLWELFHNEEDLNFDLSTMKCAVMHCYSIPMTTNRFYFVPCLISAW